MPLDIKSWSVAETITGTKLNTHLSDKLTALRSKNISVHTITAVYNCFRNRVANTVVQFDTPITLVHTMPKAGTILARFSLPAIVRRHAGAVATAQGRVDIKVNDDWFFTSGTSTSLTDGFLVHNMANLHYQMHLSGHFIIDNIPEGQNKYELWGASAHADFSMELLAGGQWSIEEYTENLADFLLLGEPL